MALRVLLADENVTIKKAIQLSLQDYAVSVKSVNLGVDVLDVARGFKPDIVFADILLQKRSGYDVCSDFKTDPELQGIPVILMWSGFMELDQERFLNCGANGELEKPFDRETLRQLVHQKVHKTTDHNLGEHLELPDFPTAEMQELKTPDTAAPPPPPAPIEQPTPIKPVAEIPPPPMETALGTVPTPKTPPQERPPKELSPQEPQAKPPSPQSAAPPTTPEAPPPSWNMDSFENIEDFVGTPLGELHASPPPAPPAPQPALTPDTELTETWTQKPIESLTDQTPSPPPPPNEGLERPTTAPPRDEDWVHEDLSAFKIELPEDQTPTSTHNIEYDLSEDELKVDHFLVDNQKIEESPPPQNPPTSEPPAPPAQDLTASTKSSNSEIHTAPLNNPEQELEDRLRAQSREVIESIVWKVVPDLAERIIREELEKIMRDPSP